MDGDVLAIVSGQSVPELTMTPANLSGYVQRAVVAQDFPVLVADGSGSTQGVIISGLTASALERILFFEGDEYVLADIAVETEDGRSCTCQYFRDTAVYDVADQVWNFQRWRETEKSDFVVRTEKFMRLFGVMSATAADEFW